MRSMASALHHGAVLLGVALLLALSTPESLAHQVVSPRHTQALPGSLRTSVPLARGPGLRSRGTGRAPTLQSRERHAVPFSGVVVNSTHGDRPVARQTVTLQALKENQPTAVASVPTGGDGRFTFANVTPDPGASYLLTTQYQGGAFATSEIPGTQLGAQPVTLHVFDTTTSDANLQVGLATLVIGEPKWLIGLIPIAESVTMFNTGRTAYVASLPPSGDRPMSLLRFALPTGATGLVLGVGFATGQVTQVATGLGVGATLPPGKTEFAFAYNVAYTGSTYPLNHKTEYTTRQVAVLVPTDISTAAGDFTARPVIKAAGRPYQLLVHNDAAPLTTLSLSLRNLPAPGEPQYLDVRSLALVAGLIAALLLFLLALYLRRGDLMFLLGLPGSPPAGGSSQPEHGEARQSLLSEHLALDQARSAGKLDETDYRQRRDALRTQLRTLLAAERLPLPAAAGEGEGGGPAETATPAGSPPRRSREGTGERSSPRRRTSPPLTPRRGLFRQPTRVQEEARHE